MHRIAVIVLILSFVLVNCDIALAESRWGNFRNRVYNAVVAKAEGDYNATVEQIKSSYYTELNRLSSEYKTSSESEAARIKYINAMNQLIARTEAAAAKAEFDRDALIAQAKKAFNIPE